MSGKIQFYSNLTKGKNVRFTCSVRYIWIGVELRYRNFTMTDDMHLESKTSYDKSFVHLKKKLFIENRIHVLPPIFPSYITCDSSAFFVEIT